MATPIVAVINHVELSGSMEWSMRAQQVLGGRGRATMVIQDRTNSLEIGTHEDVLIYRRSTGKKLFRGEVINAGSDLPVGMPFRRWKLECSDYSIEFPQRKVGAFDGKTWQDVDGLGDYVNIDPNGHSLETDKLTIQHLMDKYIRVDGEAIGTDTFVNTYLTDFATITWAYSDLEQAFNEMAAMIAKNLQYWLDPDLEYHWEAIPPWQDELQTLVGQSLTPELNQMSMLFPTGSGEIVTHHPGVIQHITDVPNDGNLGGRALSFTYDGSAMPEQIYVRGGTGFVYNAEAITPTGESVTINPEGYGTKSTEILKLTFLATTKIWQKQANGLISSSFSTIGAGGPYDVKFIRVPYNPANGKGGHFWKLLTGPKAGWLVDNDTSYFGYGQIRVDRTVVVTTPPSIGVGGSGWVHDVLQDLNKRQAYLEAEISTTQALRDSIGDQQLYRGQFPTLRASITVTGGTDPDGNVRGPDGWRVGQIVRITDARLPALINGKYFIIQAVDAAIIAATDLCIFKLDFGDGPTSRYTWQRTKTAAEGEVTWPPGATEFVIDAFDLSPGPNSTQVIVGQLRNKAGEPWKIAGKVVKWSLEVYDSAGALIAGQGSIIPVASATDANGRARTVLTTGSASSLVYFVWGEVAAE